MIATVTLNPALDRTLAVPSIRFGDVLRAESVRLDWGGKGFNVSRALKELGPHKSFGGDSLVMGLVGGATGEALEEGLLDLGLDTDLIRITGETRTNTVITDLGTGQHIKVNEPGPRVDAQELARLVDKIRQRVQPGDLWALSGSLPIGAPSDFYAHLINLIQTQRARALLDTSGESLRQGLEAKPFLVKPNAEEAGAVLGRPIRSDSDAQDAARAFLDRGVALVALSLGAGGLLLATVDQSMRARPPRVRALSPVGAGDALLAGITWAMAQGLSLAEMARWGTATGTASALKEGSGVGTRGEIADLYARTRVSPVQGKDRPVDLSQDPIL